MTTHIIESLTRPIAGIEYRTAEEVFDIMSDRIKIAFARHAHQAREEERDRCARIAYNYADMNAGSDNPLVQASEAAAIGIATILEHISTKGQAK